MPQKLDKFISFCEGLLGFLEGVRKKISFSQDARRYVNGSNVRGTLLTAFSAISIQQQAVRFTLSVPVQMTLYTSLCALTLWTVYFTSYPAIHNQAHSLRHHTLMVACH